jgi:hypothetical protein
MVKTGTARNAAFAVEDYTASSTSAGQQAPPFKHWHEITLANQLIDPSNQNRFLSVHAMPDITLDTICALQPKYL